ncbi:hypothetical protein PAMA_013121 [Pampus argenteus]
MAWNGPAILSTPPALGKYSGQALANSLSSPCSLSNVLCPIPKPQRGHKCTTAVIDPQVKPQGQLAAGTCEIVTLDRDSSQPRRTIARQTARCACKKGQIAGTTRARPACVDVVPSAAEGGGEAGRCSLLALYFTVCFLNARRLSSPFPTSLLTGCTMVDGPCSHPVHLTGLIGREKFPCRERMSKGLCLFARLRAMNN